jgi:hypothetical protein
MSIEGVVMVVGDEHNLAILSLADRFIISGKQSLASLTGTAARCPCD